jgi:predicted permease
MHGFWQDLRYAVRTLSKSPGFAAAAVLTLALGIGANTAIFSLLDAVMLRNLPVKNPQRLVLLRHILPDDWNGSFDYSEFEQLRDHSASFSGIFAFDSTRLSASANGQADFVLGQCVSGSFYTVLGVNAIVGRTFTAEDDRAAQPPVAVISYDYWQRRFALDPSVAGQNIMLKGISFTVVGVTPPGFRGIEPGDAPDIWVPMTWWKQVRLNDHLQVGVMARLKPAATAQQAGAELTVIDRQAAILAARPAASAKTERELSERRVEAAPGGQGLSDLRGELSKPLFILTLMVALVLLIACGNVANLFLARAAARHKEIAVRMTLGAGRWRLIRQLLTESILLALAGGAIGLLFAVWAGDFLLQLVSGGTVPLPVDLHADARVLAFTAGAALLTSIGFGLAPALRSTRMDLTPALKGSAPSAGALASRFGLRNALVISQVAMSLVLLVGAGLLVRSLQKLSQVPTGFHEENVLLLSAYPTSAGYEGQRELDLYARLQERVSAIPEVRSVSISRFSLLSGGRWGRTVVLPGKEIRAGEELAASCNPVAPRFFETMGIPLLRTERSRRR